MELMDPAGQTARARVVRTSPDVQLDVESVNAPANPQTRLIVASAVPKGARADWMIEKLSELGVETFIPLETRRSVVHPEAGKRQRWARIAEESAKQCRRQGFLHIAEPTSLEEVATLDVSHRICLSTEPDSTPVTALPPMVGEILATVGPEGGWTTEEMSLLLASRFRMAALTSTILRIETAAIAIASIIMCSTKEKETS